MVFGATIETEALTFCPLAWQSSLASSCEQPPLLGFRVCDAAVRILNAEAPYADLAEHLGAILTPTSY